MLPLFLFSCADEFLSREPLDKLEDNPQYWNLESNVYNSVLNLYPDYFVGYSSGWAKSDFYEGTYESECTDDFAQKAVTMSLLNVPTTDGGWSFKYVRRINHMLTRVQNSTMPEVSKNHWIGVIRFFRAMEYADLVRKFGDVPWYDKVLSETDFDELYKPRTSRADVMKNVYEDLNFAIKNVREKDDFGVNKLKVNRDVVLAFSSRIMLFEGTYQKYHHNNTELATLFLTLSQESAKTLIDSKKYSVAPDYKSLTTSLDLSSNPEIILFRAYAIGVLGHSEMSYQNEQAEEDSPSKDLIDSYVTKNGLPIYQENNNQFMGDKWLKEEIKNRDPRLYQSVDTSRLMLNGVEGLYAISGYFSNKFINESIKNKPEGQSATNATDAPVMRYGEVLLNYAEASAELSELGARVLTQNDIDLSINVIRGRASVKLPALQLNGNNFSVSGIQINDPERDESVSPVLWEIRRERRVELVYEGFRYRDLLRWKKLHYADMTLNSKLNKGAWLDKPFFVKWYNENVKPTKPITIESLSGITLDRDGTAGYIKPITDNAKLRKFENKHYLYPLPLDQITLYKDQGKELTQNPGW